MVKQVVASFDAMDFSSNDEIETDIMEWSPWCGSHQFS